ncbi:MAG: hypothetical protein GEU93_05310 [Propionibacteriales bacterium]|nr:hypothetical protein [Propionibacteriales bacterium]
MALWVRYTGRVVVVAGVGAAAMVAMSSTSNATDSTALGDLLGPNWSTNETANQHVDDALIPVLGLVDVDSLTNLSTTTRRPTASLPAGHVGKAPVEEIAPADQRPPTVPATGDSSVTSPPVMSSATAEDGAEAAISSTDCADLKSTTATRPSGHRRCVPGQDTGTTSQNGSDSRQSSGYGVADPQSRPDDELSAPATAPTEPTSSHDAQPGTADSTGLGRAVLDLVSGQAATQADSADTTAPGPTGTEPTPAIPGIAPRRPEGGIGDLTRLALQPVTRLPGGLRPLTKTVDRVSVGAVEPVVDSLAEPVVSAVGSGGLSIPVDSSGVRKVVSGLLSHGQSPTSGASRYAGRDDADHGDPGAPASDLPVPALHESGGIDGETSCITTGPGACALVGASAGRQPATGAALSDRLPGGAPDGEGRASGIRMAGSPNQPVGSGSGSLAGGSAPSGGAVSAGPTDTDTLGLSGPPEAGLVPAGSWRLPGSPTYAPGHSPD